MKKHFSILLAAMIIILSLPIGIFTLTANAETVHDNYHNISWEFDKATGTLTVSGDGLMLNLDYNNNPWYIQKNKIKKVVFEGNVLSIGRYAFYGCTNLTEVTLPSSVITIEEYAFYGCTALKELSIPRSVTEIEYFAFSWCPALEKITVEKGNPCYYSENNCIINKEEKSLVLGCKNSTVPDNIIYIRGSAFTYCSELKEIYIPKSVGMIEGSAFNGCSDLEKITVEAGNPNYSSNGNCLINIQNRTLEVGCKNSVIPTDGSVYSIVRMAFYNCAELKEINIPKSVNIISNLSFAGCCGLEKITVEDGNPNYASKGNCLIATYNKTLLIGGKDAVIPADGSVTDIADYAFLNSTLKEINIPASIINIGRGAFNGCSNVEKITVEEGNENYISKDNCLIFASINQLVLGCKNSIIPDDGSVTKIRFDAFSGCSGLEKVSIPNGVTVISSYVFQDCTSLKTVFIPESVKAIQEGAFYGCTSLKNIYYAGSEEAKAEIDIQCTADELENVEWHYGADPADIPDESESDESVPEFSDSANGSDPAATSDSTVDNPSDNPSENPAEKGNNVILYLAIGAAVVAVAAVVVIIVKRKRK